MLVSSQVVQLFERFRIPYIVDPGSPETGLRVARADRNGGAELISIGASVGANVKAYALRGAIVFASLADEAQFEAVLQASGKEWIAEIPICDLAGVPQAAIRQARDGSVAIPFAIDEPFDMMLQELYVLQAPSRFRDLARRAYYLLRPLFPYSLQMALRRRFRRVQDKSIFPTWPTETSLHRLEGIMLGFIEDIAGEPVPWLAPWPEPYTWAMVLTHDIERIRGYHHVGAVLALEMKYEVRSAWYFVPERDYSVEEPLLDELRRGGGEICLHGLRHDGRDMSRKEFYDRLPAMRSYLDRWGARGFRAPSTLRDSMLLGDLGVEHDSSWSDVARYEPKPGGSCSWLPFFIGDVVELPITLPMDHTLFELRGERTPKQWIEKAAFLREHEGMALLVTHPDYLLDDAYLQAYKDFLASQALDSTVWRALPHEVAAWWRRRAESRIELRDGSWKVVGPAASDASLRLEAPRLPPPSAAAPLSDRDSPHAPG